MKIIIFIVSLWIIMICFSTVGSCNPLRVVYPASSALQSAPIAVKLSKELKQAGTQAEAYADSSAEKDYEFLIGECKRKNAGIYMSRLNENEIIISPEGIFAHSVPETEAGVNYYIQEYVSKGKKNSEEKRISVPEARLAYRSEGSLHKHHYSDYNKDYEEQQLISFDDLDIPGETFFNSTVTVDRQYQREGRGALRFVVAEGGFHELLYRTGPAFHLSVDDTKTTTLKIWVFLDDVNHFASDHDSLGRQINQATIFFRIMDEKNRWHAWNHTLEGSGWHEVELTFNIHNGFVPDIDYLNLTGFGLMLTAKPGTIVELDDLRAVKYHTDYKRQELSAPARLISDCEYNSFDGCVVQEWYGSSFRLGDSLFGKSSYTLVSKGENGDYRLYCANNNIPIDYYNDELVLWMKINDYSSLNRLFIEMNETQDVFEYENVFSVDYLKKHGLTENGRWCRVKIPLTDMKVNCPKEKENEKYNMPMKTVRFALEQKKGKLFCIQLDKVYIIDKNMPDPVKDPREK